MNWLRKFMAGRYGVDALSWTLLVLFLVISLVGDIARLPILSLAVLPLVVWCWFRILSRNTYKRSMENMRFLQFFRPLTTWYTGVRNRARDKTHRYYRCPKCRHRLRVPRGKGKIQITCPKCREKFVKKT
nr:hypothetical protein [Maliibacterium massiliense]